MRLTIRTTSLLMLFLLLEACAVVDVMNGGTTEDFILERYNAFMITPNLPEICRAASRPSDTFNGGGYYAKEAALRAVNDRNIQCDWSAEMKYWGDYALNQIQAQARVDAVEAEAAANYQAGGLLRAEPGYPGFLRCVYSNGTVESASTILGCPSTN